MLRRLALLLLAMACLAPTARAHDPFLAEIETETAADTFVLRVLLARSVAGYLAGLTPNPRAYFPPADFSARQDEFGRLAAQLCVLSVDDAPLAPLRTGATLGPDEEEIVFILTYPRPASAKVRLDCAWLAHLPEGYAAGTRRGGGKLTAENSAAYLRLSPAPASAP